jgi:uncharacterized protein (TIGR02145 family)
MNMFNRQGWTLLFATMLTIGTHTAWAQQSQNYTGGGGSKVISLTIYVPQSTGLAKNQGYIPALVQGEFVSNFFNYSGISVLDWERLDDIYVKLTDEAYDDKADAKQDVVLGRLAPTTHFLTGNITKTATGYNIKVNITATADKMTVATYSGTFSFAELDNLTGVRRASLELLQQVGVELTDKARQELAGAAEANQILAQTALAKGVTAQRQGTSVAALSYYYQAASFNPTLKEAVKRSSVMAANISSGNIGADVRNDILWRKNWAARLKETEEAYYEMVNSADPPYTLYYSTDIKTGNINYQKETADLSIAIYLSPNWAWFKGMQQALQAAQSVLSGLNSTNRKSDWGLDGWPKRGVSETNPFASSKKYDFTVVFELVNQQGRVIGNQAVRLNPEFSITVSNIEFTDISKPVNFNSVGANDISDNLTIRVASVNGAPPHNARFTIAAMPTEKPQPLVDNRDGKIYNTVRIGGKVWMSQNLDYQPRTGNSWCNQDNNSNCVQYGRLYDWNTAIDACPVGWHLPYVWEWRALINAVGSSAGAKLKAKSGWDNYYGKNGNGTDEYGFSALPGGYRDTKGFFVRAGSRGFWWTATEWDSDAVYCRIMSNFSDDVYEQINRDYDVKYTVVKGHGFSVRCRRDD